ncbi:MAG: STAS domain-containing protein [Deltaproteobacteria bacterium]
MIFDIDGPLAMPWVADELRADVNTIIESGRHDLVLDLADVPYVDSTGIGVLVTICSLIRGAGGKLVLLSVPNRVRELMKRLHLDGVFTFSDDTTLAFTRS